MTPLLVILAVAAGSYAMRATMLVLVTSKPLPARLDGALALVGPAAIAALIASALLTRDGSVAPLPAADVVAVAAGFVAVRMTGNVIHAFAVGLPALWLLSGIGL